MQDRPACHGAAQILDRDGGGGFHAGFGGDMGGDGHAGMGPEGMAGGQRLGAEHIQHRMDKLQKDSGVRLKHNALRHSFCTYRASTEKDLAKVALEAGNSVTMLQQHYVRVQLEEGGRAWFAIMPK